MKSREESMWCTGISSQGIAEGERGRRDRMKGERGRDTETERFPGEAIAIAWHLLKFPLATLVSRVQY